jgi:hypothetical protein
MKTITSFPSSSLGMHISKRAAQAISTLALFFLANLSRSPHQKTTLISVSK